MEVYQHFRKEEHPFIDQVLSWKDQVERSFQPKLSDFLTPREQTIFQSIIGNNSDMKLSFFGGKESAERKRAILAPYYEEIAEDDFQISLLEATYPIKFISIEHRDVLGAFLSLGMKRKKLGDLVVYDGTIQLLVDQEIESYVKVNLTEVKKANVLFEQQPFSHLIESQEKWEQKLVTASSLRLDAVLKEIYQLSRQNAAAAIQKGLVKVNYQSIENTSFLVEKDDLISFRGKGRSKIDEVHGLSKKDKWKMTVGILK
ncbi:RNA-binding protein [Aquibacillus salsiterrae]|uniref:RNA-binding protein n=1 Tax=Aquibacillus salsiterrae TaxID=2950439 RepID=A0A9X3WFG7_9BACI|nr:RNA-binding protein [Aquibacillus salsiterrae]MDC3416464.1 RNA-binding protein [Aquibacillus salsiterrae]